jgi:hypothetical protein
MAVAPAHYWPCECNGICAAHINQSLSASLHFHRRACTGIQRNVQSLSYHTLGVGQCCSHMWHCRSIDSRGSACHACIWQLTLSTYGIPIFAMRTLYARSSFQCKPHCNTMLHARSATSPPPNAAMDRSPATLRQARRHLLAPLAHYVPLRYVDQVRQH